MANAVTGVEKIELAPIGTAAELGLMPTSGWVTFQDIQEESVSFNIPEVQVTNIRVEDKSGVRYVLPGTTDPPEFTANSISIDGAIAEMLFGGSWDSVNKKYSAPTVDTIKSLPVRMHSKPFNGEQFILDIPVASIVPGMSGSFTKTGMVAITFTARATTPVDAEGDALSPWQFSFEDVV